MDHDGVEVLEDLQLFHMLAAQAPELPFGWQLGMDEEVMRISTSVLTEQTDLLAVTERGDLPAASVTINPTGAAHLTG